MNKKTISYCMNFAISKLDDHPYRIKSNGKMMRSKFLHYSFIIKNNTVVAWGWNHHGQAPKGFGYSGETIHSEVHAFERARYYLDSDDKFEVLNLRFNKSGVLNMSKPCKCCTNFLKTLGCKSVYFSTGCGIASMRI
ncbi:MAG: hypothetical protein ACOC5T_04980 [Elusimicrobiota bacterium]